MHEDLRRRALESGKTVSKKAQARSQQSSKHGSRVNSSPTSRNASRVVSRNASDDEDERSGNLSDDTVQSINSIDALLESDDFNEQTTEVLKQDLSDCIEELLERKGSSSKSREDALITYDKLLTNHHFGDILYGRVDDLLKAFAKSIRAETTSKETIFALRAVSLTAISFETSTLYDMVAPLIKKTVSDSQDHPTKAAAIQCLGICLAFGGAGEDEIAENMTFLLEVIQSDGSFVGADDNAAVVTAAIQTYAFLVTLVDDVEDESEDAVEALMEQLDSGDVSVQIAAGQAIALLFEKSYTPREEDETLSETEEADDEHDDLSDDDSPTGDKSLVKRYNAYHNPGEVLDKVSSLASLSTKSMNRHDKKKLHQAFASIATTIQNPRLGLQANNSSKLTVRIHREGDIRVDRWWKLMRLTALRRELGGGFINHYWEGNKQVLNAIPVIIRSAGGAGGNGAMSPRRTPRKGDKYKESRRFVSADAS